MNNTDQYIGARKIIGVTELKEKSPAGSPMVKIVFEDGTVKETTEMRFNLTKSDVPSDATTVGQKIRMTVGSMIYAMLNEYDISMAESNPVMDECVALINSATDKATNYLFGVEYPDDRTLLQINNILIQHVESKSDKDNTITSSEGGTTD